MQKTLLGDFYGAIPFLQLLPSLVANQLGTTEFYMPRQDINLMRVKLEKELDHYVMTYKKDMFDLTLLPAQHLCANVKGATLTDQQLMLLTRYETISLYYGVTFVVYQKPLSIIPVSESNLYSLYQSKNL